MRGTVSVARAIQYLRNDFSSPQSLILHGIPIGGRETWESRRGNHNVQVGCLSLAGEEWSISQLNELAKQLYRCHGIVGASARLAASLQGGLVSPLD